MEVLRMDTISDLSSTQEYSDIDLEGDSREIEAGSPGDVSMVAAVEVRKLAAAGISGAAAGHRSSRSVCGSDGELPPSPHGLSPGCSRPTSPSSAASSSMNSPQPQINAVAPPPIRVTNFFISEILKPHFGGQKDEVPSKDSPNSSPVRPEAERSPSISPAKSENRSPRSDKDSGLKSSGPKREIQEEFTERRAFQVVKRKRNKSEEERNSDICKLSIRDELEQGVDLGSSRTGRQRDFPAGLPHGFPPGIPPMVPAALLGGPHVTAAGGGGGGGPGAGHPIHPSLQAHLYPQLINSRYYQQYHPYYQLYYQQYQQLQQLQRQQQLYSALQQQNNGRLDASGAKSGLSLDIHHSAEGEIPLPRMSGGKSGVFSSPHKFNHILRDFPENYESFRNGVSPERRSSTSSENDSVLSDKPVRNLTKSFECNVSPPSLHSSKNNHNHDHKPTNTNSKRNSSNIDSVQNHSPHHQHQRLSSSDNKGKSAQTSLTNNNSPISEAKCPEGQVQGKDGKLWPAWVYCTRYSDRPSSGPRSRKVKKRKGSDVVSPESQSQSPGAAGEDKRPRTAFSAEQLAKLKKEFDENRYLTEQRRQQLARDLGLNESQIKIWFQNKRAKVKKASGQKNRLAMELMAQGLYNHATVPVSEEDK